MVIMLVFCVTTQGLALAPAAGSGVGFPAVLTTDFTVCWGIAGASPAAGFHPGLWGSRIFWLQSKVCI